MKTTIWQMLRAGERDHHWTVRLEPAGMKPITRGGFATKPEAKAAALLMSAALERGDNTFLEQMRRRSVDRLGELLDAWSAAGCPGRKGRDRTGSALRVRLDHVAGPLVWWADHSASTHTDTDRRAYWQHRVKTVIRGIGDRTTELELGSLNDALHWAWRTGALKELPREMRTSFRDPATIEHARSAMPTGAAELHRLAGWLFVHRQPVYGWLCLWKAFTGLRDDECEQLQANPQRIGHDYPVGYADAQWLRIKRSKHGCNPRIGLDDPQRPHIRPLLDMIRAWHAAKVPSNPYLFASPYSDGPACDFTKHLQAAAAALGLPKRRGHSLRAYYASVRLAQGQPPETVAKELGQRSGEDLVRDVYGVDPDDFDAATWTSLSDRFTWIPTADHPPAWTWWTEAGASKIQPFPCIPENGTNSAQQPTTGQPTIGTISTAKDIDAPPLTAQS